MTVTRPADLSQDGTKAVNSTPPDHPTHKFWALLKKASPGLPARSWARIVVLFSSLVLIKLLLLVRLSKHLFQIHWRVESPESNSPDYFSYYGFVSLGVLSLIIFGSRCRAAGIKAVRAGNLLVLGLGLLFIFLTFHVSDKNYIYPILSGVLDWNSLTPYLSLDLFFHPPFLGAWLFVYVGLYYLLVRTGRESWMLYLTAVFAGAYGAICLRGLAIYHTELLIIDVLGLVSILFASRARGKLNPAWLLAPGIWSLFFLAEILHGYAPEFGPSSCYFFILLSGCIVLFGLTVFLARGRAWGQSWNHLVFFYFSAFVLLANAYYPVSANYNRALCLGLEFPRYFADECLITGALAVCAALYARWRPKGRLWWLDICNLALIALALVDLRLCRVLNVRLEWDVLALGSSPKMMWRMAQPYLPGLVLALVVFSLVYFALVKFILRSAQGKPGKKDTSAPAYGFWYVTATAVLLGFLGVLLANPDKAKGSAGLILARTSPVWKSVTQRRLGRDEFLQTAQALGMRNFEAPTGAVPLRPRRDLNVLMVFMESSYNKYLSLFGGSEDTQPLLSKYKERMEIFPNFFSNFACSMHSRFAAFTSLYPVQNCNAFTLERVGVKSLFEVLHDDGYQCSLFYSSFADFTGFRDFLKQRGLGEIYDADSMPGKRATEPVSWGLREEETLGAIRGRIQKYAHDRERFFLTYVPAAPHYPYEKVPDRFHKFKPGDQGDYTPLYLNELLYMDWVLASIVDELKESGLLDSTLVVITDDHGEMLGSQGGPIGHGWLLTPELANVPLIIMDPQNPGYHVNSKVGSQIDLLPTVLDLLGLPDPQDQLYQGHSIHGPAAEGSRVVYLNSFQQYGLLGTNQITLGDREIDQNNKSTMPRPTYTISADGNKAVFLPAPPSATPAPSIRRFDEFQENFLKNYSFYSEAVRKAASPALSRAGN